MPKTENNLYEKIIDFDNLLEGYRTFATHILPRKRVIGKARKDFNEN
jgi:uncharacterized protein YktA (UPF0223 family)